MKILVADDSKTNLTLITHSLQKLGHEVMAASHGQEAITMFQSSRPDLVILDVVMEGMDGFETAKHMRALDQKDWIPIIFLSASVDDASIARGIDAGGDDYLTKPFSEITLSAKIKAMQRIAEMRNNLYEATKKLSMLSSTDTLTSLYNRLQFNKTINEKIKHANRQENEFALLFLDLDKFKQVNDTLGHPIGDLLLIEVAQRLQACLRLDDFLARIGGDEFAIILSGIEDKEVVAVVCQKIIHALSIPYTLQGHEVHCGSSIGVVYYPSDGLDQESLSKKADVAMYHAKHSGRNCFKYYHSIALDIEEKPSVEAPIQAEDNRYKTVRNNKTTVINCLVKDTYMSIDIRYVLKNLPLPQLQRMPNAPAYWVGLMNLAGNSIPVIDLGARLNFKRTAAYTLDTPVLLCSHAKATAGFIVDKILGLCELEKHHLQRETLEKKSETLFLATVTIGSNLSLLVNIPYLLADNCHEITEALFHG